MGFENNLSEDQQRFREEVRTWFTAGRIPSAA
jgi:hypothetical protein